MKHTLTLLLICSLQICFTGISVAQIPVVPSKSELDRPFGPYDTEAFQAPPLVYHPETWFHFIGGNVSKPGITADLEAIAAAGFSGIQLFHGQFGGPWPGVTPQIACLSPLWEDAVKHTATECRRLGLRFTMQNCPGWAMSGGPWIEPSNAMRHLAWSRTDIDGGKTVNQALPVLVPNNEPWRDYQDIVVLAFPTPQDDPGEPVAVQSFKSNSENGSWKGCLAGNAGNSLNLAPATGNRPNWVEVTLPEAVTIRTLELASINSYNHAWCYEPGVSVVAEAVLADGTTKEIVHVDLPQSSWQDNRPISLACSEAAKTKTYRISIFNKHPMTLNSLRLYTASRQNNWESEAGWTLRSLVRESDHPEQSPATYVDPHKVIDVSAMMDKNGHLKWNAPAGKWTVLRVGHVNTGERNGPAPKEGTGWECNKLSTTGPDAQFAGYIGRLSGPQGALAGGLLNGMLMDSWECKTQTWTTDMEAEFLRVTGYELRKWLPALFGYVLNDPETTKRFLRDWRGTLGDLYTNRFYGRMAALAEENGLSVTYETAAGDILPVDILEYFKYADVPMCEFWQPLSEAYVGSLNFKPIKPTVSAARLYGKPRIAAEAFTSFALTWNEHWDALKEVANVNSIEGVTHLVFHTYTHNPRTDFLPPGTSFGAGIGTPFLRGQTWWKQMPEFITYLSRCNYMFERGKPVSDVLWYLGDEIDHKPDQNAPFPDGYKYDYCNPDILLNRLSVKDGALTTPEGIAYRVLWIPDNPRMLPQTVDKLLALLRDGATIVANPPKGLATLSGGADAQKKFDAGIREIWGEKPENSIRKVGKGTLVSGTGIGEALRALHIAPDVTGGEAMWLHRKTDGADWYYICAPVGKEFEGALSFRNRGSVEIWDPLTGTSAPARYTGNGERTDISLELPQAGSCFVVFRHNVSEQKTEPARNVVSKPLNTTWKLSFPSGWGVPSSLELTELKAWKDLDLSTEGKAFSGTVTYTTTFDVADLKPGKHLWLDLGRVDMIAAVSLNGKPLRTLWTSPYRVELTGAVTPGSNTLSIEVTSTWFNRLVFDAGQPEEKRKTWTINGPSKDAGLTESGLMGPVYFYIEQ